MRVAIVAPEAVPFATGGAERLCEGLRDAVAAAGHQVELVTVPTPERSYRQLIDSYETFGNLSLAQFDRVISTKYPSWMVRHPDHVVYMLHPLRGLYDSYHYFGMPLELPAIGTAGHGLASALAVPPGTRDGWRDVLGEARAFLNHAGEDDPMCTFPGPLIRSIVHWLDRDALSPANIRSYAAISRTVAKRTDYFPTSAKVRVLLPPTNMTGLKTGPYESFFTASRLDQPKRLDLLINAMGHADQSVSLRIAGAGPDEERLRGLRPNDTRITFLGRVSEEQLVDEYSRALAVPFLPLDEDFGLVALEAQLAGKPVITCTDSGGVTELVNHGVSGLVVEPTPVAVGRALTEIALSPEGARIMGTRGREAATKICWEHVVDGLVDDVDLPTRRRTRKRIGLPKLVVLSTYAAVPAFHGGQLRMNRLLTGLSQRFRIEVVALDHSIGVTKVSEPMPNLRQTLVPRSAEHIEREGEMAARSSIPVGDIASAVFAGCTPELIRAIKDEADGACGAIIEHPYMLPALRLASASLPFVYSAHNAETQMKAGMLAGSTHGAQLVSIVETVERAAVRGAELISVCSTQDLDILRKLGPTLADWVLVPNGSDVATTQFVTGRERSELRRVWLANLKKFDPTAQWQRVALFVGSYHKPNLEAAEFIVALAARMPDVCFVLAGSLEIHFKSWRLPPNVVVSGQLSHTELRQLLAIADV
ncbi:MAG: glycosyl transferase group 1, partial [Pseudonocardiales bacterium]|nr:glycosyl transferase group 1 [Pseudonocardiales bacterium]